MLTAQQENLTETLEELKPHFEAHHRELALFQDRMPLDPDYPEYLRRDAAGMAFLVTLREDGRVAGYLVAFITTGLHYKSTLTCTTDIFYLEPRLRKSGAGALMFNTAKTALEKRGVKLWWAGSKNHKPSEAFLGAMGFSQEEAYFALWLGD